MFRKKKSMVLILVLLLVANTRFVNAETCVKTKDENDVIKDDPLHDYIPGDEAIFEDKVTLSSTIGVPVTSPCDQFWRSNYPNNWMWQAKRSVSGANHLLNSRYGIQLYSVSQKIWDSSSTDTGNLVNEAKNEWGLRDGARLMIAFSGRNCGKTIGQVTGIGQPYCVILDNQYEANKEIVQHEVGHCYGLRHINGDNNCVMTASGLGHLDTICSTHNNIWSTNKNRY